MPTKSVSAARRSFESDETVEPKSTYRNLPNKDQLAVLCLARLCDPLAATSIQSYLFFQLKFFDPAASDAAISTQAGFIVSAKTAAQVCTGVLWGRLADSERFGRRNVLLIGLLSSGIASVGYGLSQSFASAIAWQIFKGAMSSNIALVRCMAAELNEEKRHRTRALLLLPLFANAGMLIGPLVGGTLSSQEGYWLLKSYPYLAPNIFVAAIHAIAAFGVLFRLNETLESLRHDKSSLARSLWRKATSRRSTSQSYTLVATEDPANPTLETRQDADTLATDNPLAKTTSLPFRQIWTANVLCTMLNHFIISGHRDTFSNLWAIFLSTHPGDPQTQHPPLHFTGGLGLQPREIGLAMSLLGTIAVILQATVYPTLNDKYGTLKIWRISLFIFPFVYIVAPFPSLAASLGQNLRTRAGTQALVWATMLPVLVGFVLGRTGITPATTLLINDCTPHPSVRATIHTTGSGVGNLARTIFPVVALGIYGLGLRVGVVGVGFWCLAGLAVVGCVASRWVKQGKGG